MNADKAPSAASFDQRLTLMTLFAGDLLTALEAECPVHSIPPIDIGVTTVPYYTDKSQAIESEGRDFYSAQPQHVHLIGFDTLTRFFGAKYYKKFDPPFSALVPYFDEGRHKLRVTLRPDGDDAGIEKQQAFVHGLAAGDMESDGGKRKWADQIELVSPSPQVGVSSTRIRQAAKQQNWSEVSSLCPPSIATWVREEALYENDDQGAKMA